MRKKGSYATGAVIVKNAVIALPLTVIVTLVLIEGMKLMFVHIPDSLKASESEIKAFFDAMIFKLAKNSHKGKWEDLGIDKARTRVVEEFNELNEALAEGNTIEIILEAADVANFALILANIAIRDAGKHEPETFAPTKAPVRSTQMDSRP